MCVCKLNSPYFVQVLPVLHLGRVRIQLGQVPAQEHLAVLDLRRLLRHPFLHRALVAAVSCREDARRDVVFEQLLVHDVYDCRDDCFDVLLAFD